MGDLYLLWGISLGALSAVSLPMGSVFGLVLRPKATFTAFLGAFGAGALIAALTIELVAPTVLKLHTGGAEAQQEFWGLVLGSVAGGVLFVVLDQLVNMHGGFLRKSASYIAYFSTRKKIRDELMLSDLSRVELMHEVPLDQVQFLVDRVTPVEFEAGERVFDQGEEGDSLYFIRSGRIELYEGDEEFKEVGEGSVLGEIALLTGAPRTAKAVACSRVKALRLSKVDFDCMREISPKLDQAARALASERIEELRSIKEQKLHVAEQWASGAVTALQTGIQMPTGNELARMRHEHQGAPLAIWLGILLDGIPESIVIGAGFFALLTAKLAQPGADVVFSEVVPYTLIAGLFLSNFPEAMSSSIGMRMQGWKPVRIIGMWMSLVVITALGAGLGYMVGGSFPETWVVTIEGMAAGAMLTMIASAMLPEAVQMGGSNLVGLSTLTGFLSAIVFKLLE